MKIKGFKLNIYIYIFINIMYIIFLNLFYQNKSNHNYYFVLVISLIFTLITLLFSLFKYHKLMIIINYIILLLYSLFLITQNIYNRVFGSYYRFKTLEGLFKELIGVTDSAIELIKISDYFPLIALTLITILCFAFYKKHTYKLKIEKFLLIAINFGIIVFLIINFHIKLNLKANDSFIYYKSELYVFNEVKSVEKFVNIFGLNTLLYKELLDIYQNKTVKIDVEVIDNYFNSKKTKLSNEMTGIFKDKNLFIIQAESLMNAGINKELTPTLYWFKNQGIDLKEFNTPLLLGSTSDSEFMANTSIIPITDGFPVCYEYDNNSYKQTLAESFKQLGYKAYAFHNNYAEYYNRDVVFKNYGYKFHDATVLGFENFIEDSKISESLAYISIGADPFISYWISVSGHQPYELNTYGATNKDDILKIKKLYPNLSDDYVSYLAKSMDLDKALSNIVNIIDGAGKLDDTVFIIFGDHKAKGLDISENSLFCKEVGCDLYSGNTTMIIFNTQIDKKIDNKVKSTALDIFPTIANMYDLKVDYRYLIGNDIFDNQNEGLHFFNEGIYATNNFIYNFITEEIIKSDGIYTTLEIEEKIKEIELKMKISEDILKSDYFK